MHQFKQLQTVTFHSDSASTIAAFNAAFVNPSVTQLSLVQWTKLEISIGLLRQAFPNVHQLQLGALRAKKVELRYEQFVAAFPMHYAVISELKKTKINKIIMSESLYMQMKNK